MPSINYIAKKGYLGTRTPLLPIQKVWFDYGSTQIYEGSIVQWKQNADPENSAFAGYEPGSAVQAIAAANYDNVLSVAGIVVGLGDTGGTADGWIFIQRPVRGEIVTLAVAEGTDSGDFIDLAASGVADDGGTTDAAINMAEALYDEDNANNPHGTSALGSGTGGLVEAFWIGGGLEDS